MWNQECKAMLQRSFIEPPRAKFVEENIVTTLILVFFTASVVTSSRKSQACRLVTSCNRPLGRVWTGNERLFAASSQARPSPPSSVPSFGGRSEEHTSELQSP